MDPGERGDVPVGVSAAGEWSTLELVSAAPDTARIRRWAQALLSDVAEDDLVDVLLVITELASNVFDHALFPARLKVRRSAEPCVVSIVAEDASSVLPQLRPSTPDSSRSRGLVLVNQLSAQWGVLQRTVGKSVWASMPCATVD